MWILMSPILAPGETPGVGLATDSCGSVSTFGQVSHNVMAWKWPTRSLAARVGISELSDRHWEVIRFPRNHFLEHGMGPTVRLRGKASGVSIREFYRLFPRSPSYVAARIAGVPKLYLCQNGSWLRTARVAAMRAAAH